MATIKSPSRIKHLDTHKVPQDQGAMDASVALIPVIDPALSVSAQPSDDAWNRKKSALGSDDRDDAQADAHHAASIDPSALSLDLGPAPVDALAASAEPNHFGAVYEHMSATQPMPEFADPLEFAQAGGAIGTVGSLDGAGAGAVGIGTAGAAGSDIGAGIVGGGITGTGALAGAALLGLAGAGGGSSSAPEAAARRYIFVIGEADLSEGIYYLSDDEVFDETDTTLVMKDNGKFESEGIEIDYGSGAWTVEFLSGINQSSGQFWNVPGFLRPLNLSGFDEDDQIVVDMSNIGFTSCTERNIAFVPSALSGRQNIKKPGPGNDLGVTFGVTTLGTTPTVYGGYLVARSITLATWNSSTTITGSMIQVNWPSPLPVLPTPV